MENFAPYSLAGDTDGAFNPANLTIGTHSVKLTPFPQPNLNGTPGPSTTITFQVVDNPNITPILLMEENSNQAVAMNAATFMPGPFSLFTQQNFGSDKRTRVLLFVTDFDSLNENTMSDAFVQVESDGLGPVALPIEHIAKVPLLDWLTQLTVVLPDSLRNAGELRVTIRLNGASTNQGLMRIKPSGSASTEPSFMNLFKDPWIMPDLRFLWPVPARRQNS